MNSSLRCSHFLVLLLLVLFQVRGGLSQSCFESNVYCVTNGNYTSIQDAYEACAVNDSRTDCIIMIHGGTYSENVEVTHAMSPSTTGLFVAYNGIVTWRLGSGSPTRPLTISADNWVIRGNGTNRITFWGENMESVVEIGSCSGVTIGPDVTIDGAPGAVPSAGVRHIIGGAEKDIIIEGVTFTTQDADFGSCIQFWQATKEDPGGSSYRLIVRDSYIENCQFGIDLKNTYKFLIESNYLLALPTSGEALVLASAQYGIIRNNIFESIGSNNPKTFVTLSYPETGELGDGYQTTQNAFISNTLICGLTRPGRGAFGYQTQVTDPLKTPCQNRFENLLLDGECATTGGGDELFQGGTPDCGSSCMDSGSNLACIRSTMTMNYYPSGGNFNEDHTCPGDANGGGATIGFEAIGDKPYPYYEPATQYIGADVTPENPLDMARRSRLATGSSMGAIEHFPGPCAAPNVFCVDGWKYTTIQSAYDACAVTEGRKDCVIRIKAKNGTEWYGPPTPSLTVTHSMNASTPGLIIPYRGDVRMMGFNIFTINADNWHVRGDDGYRLIFIGITGQIAVKIENAANVTIGPDVTIDGNVGTVVVGAGIWYSGTNETGIVIDGVTFDPNEGEFASCIEFSQVANTDPGSTYRLVVKGTSFVGCTSKGISIENTRKFLIDSNYFLHGSGKAVSLSSAQYGVIQNNVFEATGTVESYVDFAYSSQGDNFQSIENEIRANTFICGTAVPTSGAFYYAAGGATAVQSPNRNHFSNLLLSGDCADTVGTDLIESGCGPCSNPGTTTLTCIRSSEDIVVHSGPLAIVEDHDCLGDGVNVTISFNETGPGSKPYPFYMPTALYFGEFESDNPLDYAGRVRKATSTSIGAIEYVATCNNLLATDPLVCGGNGICILDDVCQCTNETRYNGTWCDLPVCSLVMKGDEAACSRNGSCVAPDVCVCSNVSRYVGEFCEIPVCNGEPAGTANACSGHGVCVEFDECQCSNATVHAGEWCQVPVCNGIPSGTPGVCFGHGVCDRPNHCNCSDDFEGSNCETMLCGGLPATSPAVCNYGNGTCDTPGQCSCSNSSGYVGEDCEIPMCNGLVATTALSCGDGVCIAPNECDCSGVIGSPGLWCEVAEVTDTDSDSDSTTVIVAVAVGVAVPLAIIAAVIVVVVVVVCAWGVRKKKKRVQWEAEATELDKVVLASDQHSSHGHHHSSHSHKRRGPDAASMKLVEIPFADIEIGKILGQGGSGCVVHRGEWLNNEVAVKILMVEAEGEEGDGDIAEFVKEARLMQTLLHPNVLRYFGVSLDRPRLGIVMELCACGDWKTFLQKYGERHKAKRAPLHVKTRQLLEVASGMGFLHQQKVVHRDLKMQNVLIDEVEHCKIMDFGLSRVMENMSATKTKGVGTYFHMAPEITLGKDYDEKIDVFSYGMMSYLVLTEDYHPFGKLEFVQYKVANDPSCRPKVSKLPKKGGYRSLLKKCWDVEPTNRPSFSEIIKLLKSIPVPKKTIGTPKGQDKEDEPLASEESEGESEGESEEESAEEESEGESVVEEKEELTNLAIYVREKSQSEDEAEDCVVAKQTYESLLEAIEKTRLGSGKKVASVRVCGDEDDDQKGDGMIVTDDAGVRDHLVADAMVVIGFE